MVEPHSSAALWLLLALLAAQLGLISLALSLESHWEQVRGQAALPAGLARRLRLIGALGLGLSLAACLQADHASMAVLVWLMALAAGSLLLAGVLAVRASLLAPLAAVLSLGAHRGRRDAQ